MTMEANAAAHQVKTILMPNQLCRIAPIGPRRRQQDQQQIARHHRRQHQRQVDDGLDQPLAAEASAGQPIADGDGQRKSRQRGAHRHLKAQPQRRPFFRGHAIIRPISRRLSHRQVCEPVLPKHLERFR